MHDLDGTSREMNGEAFEYDELEFEWELPGGTFDRPFSEAELDELALELLQVRDEQELDQFLGSLLLKAVPALIKAAPAIGRFVRSPAGVALRGILKNAVTAAVPVLGGLIGSPLAARGVGAGVGAAIKGELEWEGAPAENRDVEAAKRVIEVGGAAAQQVAAMPPNAPPQAAADAVQSAAQQQGISTGGAPPGPNGGGMGDSQPTSGQWFRRGRSIVVVGL
jgi:hypothetical protein